MTDGKLAKVFLENGKSGHWVLSVVGVPIRYMSRYDKPTPLREHAKTINAAVKSREDAARREEAKCRVCGGTDSVCGKGYLDGIESARRRALEEVIGIIRDHACSWPIQDERSLAVIELVPYICALLPEAPAEKAGEGKA